MDPISRTFPVGVYFLTWGIVGRSMCPADTGYQRVAMVLVVSFALLLGGAVVAADGVGDDGDRDEFIVLLEGIDDDEVHGDPVEALREHAAETQAPVIEELERTTGVEIEDRFWIANALLVSVEGDGVDIDEVAAIAGVTNVSEHGTVQADAVVREQSPGINAESDYTYGLEMINAPTVWDEFDTHGEGVTVAVLDTGVDPNHPDIHVDGWKDFATENPSATPMDYARHGTHVAGTVVGGDASGTHIGVAPGADHIHGAVLTDCGPGGCTGDTAQVLDGMEWAVEEGADVVSLSLGTESYTPAMIEAVRNAKAAGSVVVASIGNDGVDTSGSPGNVYETVGVGAVDGEGTVAEFSGGEQITTAFAWGFHAPGDWPSSYVVPNVAAPGVGVLSAAPGGGYRTSQGTSMAAPHVSGTVALGQAATDRPVPNDELMDALEATAWKPDGEPSGQDHRYGHGIIDAHAFVSTLASQATVNGTVVDAVTGEPIPDATVTIDGEELTTDDHGFYEVYGVAGDVDHEIVVAAPGYEETVEEASIPADEVTSVNLAVAGDAEVSVTVTDGAFGGGVEDATVAVGDYPATTSEEGTYVVEDIPGGTSASLTVTADGYEAYDAPVSVDAGEAASHDARLVGNAVILVGVSDAVTGAAVPSTVTVERADGATVMGKTDGGGEFGLRVAGTGTDYDLLVEAPGYERATAELSLDDGETAPAVFELEGDASVVVEVTDATFGDSVPDGSVAVEGERGTYSATETAEGHYRIDAVPSDGPAELVVDADGYGTVTESLTLQAGHVLEQATELEGDATLAVAVSDESAGGPPIDGASITVQRETGSAVEVVSDDDGGATLTVPGTGETYDVSAGASGYESQEESLMIGSQAHESVELSLVGDAELAVIGTDAHFETELAELTVEITGDRGTYEGVDEVTGVPSDGTYEVRVSLAGYDPVTEEVRLDDAGRETLAIEFDGDAQLAVSVTDGETGLGGVTVTVERGDGEAFAIETDDDGTADVAVPGTGVTYDVTAEADGYETNATVVGPIESGDVEPVDVRLVAVDEGLPGFGAVAAIVALLGGGWWRYRRHHAAGPRS